MLGVWLSNPNASMPAARVATAAAAAADVGCANAFPKNWRCDATAHLSKSSILFVFRQSSRAGRATGEVRLFQELRCAREKGRPVLIAPQRRAIVQRWHKKNAKSVYLRVSHRDRENVSSWVCYTKRTLMTSTRTILMTRRFTTEINVNKNTCAAD